MSAEALHGDLGRFFLSEVLQLLQLARATGRLELERDGERAEVLIERGRPVFARATGSRVRTGDVLVHRGAISEATLEAALERQRAGPEKRLGALLVAAGAAQADQVRAAVHDAMRRTVYGLMLWREGSFRFVPGGAPEREDIRLDLDLDRLILEGLRQADEARTRLSSDPPL